MSFLRNSRERKIDFRYFCPLAVSSLSLVIQIVTFVLFLCGTVSLQGRSVSVVTAVTFVIEIFSVYSATAFPRIVALIAALFYFLFVGLIIKNIVVAVKIFPDIVQSRFSLRSRQYNADRLQRLLYEGFLTFEFVCLFAVFIGFAGGAALPVQTAFIMALTGLVFLGRGAALHSFQFGDWSVKESFPDILKDAVGFVCICGLVFLMQRPVLKELYSGSLMLYNGNIIAENAETRIVLSEFYARIVYPACFFIALVRFFVLLHEYLPHNMRKKDIIPRIRKLLVFSAVLTTVHLVATASFAGRFDFIVLANWFAVVRYSCLPMTILCAVLLCLEKYCRPARQIS